MSLGTDLDAIGLRYLGAIDGQLISLDVALVVGMTLEPLELCLLFQAKPLINPVENRFYQFLVFDRFLAGGLPSILTPILKPSSEAINRILAVCVDEDVSISWRDLNGPLDRSQLCTLICLSFSMQAFGDIPVDKSATAFRTRKTA